MRIVFCVRLPLFVKLVACVFDLIFPRSTASLTNKPETQSQQQVTSKKYPGQTHSLMPYSFLIDASLRLRLGSSVGGAGASGGAAAAADGGDGVREALREVMPL